MNFSIPLSLRALTRLQPGAALVGYAPARAAIVAVDCPPARGAVEAGARAHPSARESTRRPPVLPTRALQVAGRTLATPGLSWYQLRLPGF